MMHGPVCLAAAVPVFTTHEKQSRPYGHPGFRCRGLAGTGGSYLHAAVGAFF